jgi:hypothetical protein
MTKNWKKLQQKRPSNTSKHELRIFFLLLWVILLSWIRILDPDSESGSGSTAGYGSATLVIDISALGTVIRDVLKYGSGSTGPYNWFTDQDSGLFPKIFLLITVAYLLQVYLHQYSKITSY